MGNRMHHLAVLAVIGCAALAASAVHRQDPVPVIQEPRIAPTATPTPYVITARVEAPRMATASPQMTTVHFVDRRDHRTPARAPLSMEIVALGAVAGTTMRAKMRVQSVQTFENSPQENVHFAAVSTKPYGENGESEDNTYARYTPMADVKMTINNPALSGQIKEGQTYYVDFTAAE
jgi:hypothetical protein